MSTRVIEVQDSASVSRAAARGAKALRAGQLVGFATETVYGLAAMATSAEAMARLREIKARPNRPFSVHLGSPADAERYVRPLPEAARRLRDKAWPGPVTLLVPTGGHLADAKLRRRAGLGEGLCHEGVIGLRCPDEPVAQAMLSAVPLPVVAPSANLAGGASPRSARDVLAALDGQIDLLIDSGPCRHGADSTIVRCDGAAWHMVREGVLDAATIERLWRRTLLLVCTGNTCRSAMAEGLARVVLAERFGGADADLGAAGVEVLSAGVFACDGAPATGDAVAAVAELDADIAGHRSRMLTRELIGQADLVLCMTDSHVAEVLRLAPRAGDKVRRLDDQGDVEDPIGGGLSVYRRTAKRLLKAIRATFSKGLP